MLKAIGKFIVALNGNVKKTQIAAGVAWGVLLGLVPAGNFFWIVLFLMFFLFRNNFGSFLFSMALVKLLSPIFVLVVDNIGWQVLHIEQLQPLFTTMFNMPFVPFTKFNNTLVMGGLAGGIVLWLPVFIVFLPLITFYRNYAAPKIRNSKIFQAIAKSPLLKVIDKLYLK